MTGMPDFFPETNYPGMFASHEWVDAWQAAWSDCSAITTLQRHTDPENCRDGFYTYELKKLACIKLITLFSAGISTPVSPSLRSEYFNLDKKHAALLLQSALRFQWDQFYIPDLILDSDEYRELCLVAYKENIKPIVRDQSISYAVQLKHNEFADYLKRLGSNTRLKLFNKRKKLFLLGDIRIENVWPDIDAFIDVLNQFHQQRWGRPCYSGRNRVQITYFLKQIALVGGKPDLSIIYCNDEAISAVLDLSYLGRIYNIQSGYREKFQDGISLGTLHFGFQLEKAFASAADYYDFMAGNGKHSDYKKSLATHSTTLVSLMVVRSRWLQGLYAANDLLSRIKNQHKP